MKRPGHDLMPTDLLSRAFRLAHFLHQDRILAMDIAIEALAKMEVMGIAQDKRRYYQPAGRGAAGCFRSKVSLDRPHLLQRLVYSESEPHEKRQELARGRRRLSAAEMTVRFVKHLVKITLRRNSFYVSLGVSRLLHAYDTVEATAIYELLVQDPERFKEASYYRSRKKRLLKELQERFGSLIEVCRGPYREMRIRARDDSSRFAPLVRQCLHLFTPWDSPCPLPVRFDPATDVLSQLAFDGGHPDDEHPTEVSRMHAVLHPDCYLRLTRALGLDRPEERLAVPRFCLSQAESEPPEVPRELPELGEEDRRTIENALAERAEKRRRLSASLLFIAVDGVEVARLDLETASRVRIPVGEEAELIEVRAASGHEKVLLAACLLPGGEDWGVCRPTASAIVLEGGQRVSLTLLSPAGGHHGAGAVVEVAYRETRALRAASLFRRRLRRHVRWARASPSRRFLVVPALALLFLGLVSLTLHVMAPSLPKPPYPPARGSGSEAAPPRSPEVPSAVPEATRGVPSARSEVSLREARRIHVSFLGSDPYRQQVRRFLARELATGDTFTLTQESQHADAVLEPALGPAGGGEQLELQLVNRAGTVLWQGTYQGSADEVARRLAQDLVEAKALPRGKTANRPER